MKSKSTPHFDSLFQKGNEWFLSWTFRVVHAFTNTCAVSVNVCTHTYICIYCKQTCNYSICAVSTLRFPFNKGSWILFQFSIIYLPHFQNAKKICFFFMSYMKTGLFHNPALCMILTLTFNIPTSKGPRLGASWPLLVARPFQSKPNPNGYSDTSARKSLPR